MRGINTVFILGRLGKEVQITITQSGRSFVDISIATNRTIQNTFKYFVKNCLKYCF